MEPPLKPGLVFWHRPPPLAIAHRRQRRLFAVLHRLARPRLGGSPFDAALTVAFVFLAAALLFGGAPLPLGDPFGLGALFLFFQCPLFPMTGGGIFLPFLMLAQ